VDSTLFRSLSAASASSVQMNSSDFVHQLVEWQSLLAEATDESAHCCYAAYESLYVLHVIRPGDVEDSLDFLWVDFNTTVGDDGS
jgi:hypothetical protein